MSFFKYIKAVATGPKSNKDLTQDEIGDAIEQIIENRCEIEQAAAFLMCLRVKLESDDELKGCYKAFDKYIKRVDIFESVELGFSYDGKTDQPFLFPLYGELLKKLFEHNSDIKPFDIVVSGDFAQPAKKGLTLKHLVSSIKLSDNIKYFDRSDYFEELSQLTDLRKKLFMRTIFNTVEKLLNPANSKYAITSAFHKPYVKKYFNLFGDNYSKMIVVKGSEGNPEVFDDFKYWQSINGEILEDNLSIDSLGIEYNKEYENISVEENIEILRNPSPEILKLAKLNAAILLFTTKRVNSIQDGYALFDEL